MKIFASETHKRHNPLELGRGKLQPSTESSNRVDIITDALSKNGFSLTQPDPLDVQLLKRIHEPEYIDFLSTAWERWKLQFDPSTPAMAFTWPSRQANTKRPDDLAGQLGYYSFSADSSIVEGTWAAITDAAAMAQTAADQVLANEPICYALCRPPGHHATKDQFGGYCFLNNGALAAQRLLEGGHNRVAVLDIDYHHGNGTQDIFYDRSDVLVLSIHADPQEEFPWYSGHVSESGSGEGAGFNINLPLARGTQNKQWYEALDKALHHISSQNTDALVVALGVDTYSEDPLGTFALTTKDYETVANRIGSLGLPTVITQEGGYAVDAIGRNVVSFLSGF